MKPYSLLFLSLLLVGTCFGQGQPQWAVSTFINVGYELQVLNLHHPPQHKYALRLRINYGDGQCLAEELDIDDQIISQQNCAGTVETTKPEWRENVVACKAALLREINRTSFNFAAVNKACQPSTPN